MNKNDSLSNAINMLKHLIAFDTTSRRSNMELVEYIQSYLNEYGVSTRLTFDDTGKKANLWATIGPATTGGVVLSGHLDVVPVDGQQWSNDPFDMWESNGRLHGRGVADMKGFIAVCLAMVPQLIEKELALPIHFAFRSLVDTRGQEVSRP
jgi:acetylornithine deacetylase